MKLSPPRKPKKLPLVILHIGTEKTGTTAIQEFLLSNRRALLDQQLLTLEGFGRGNNREFVAYFQKSLDDWAKHKIIDSEEAKERYFSDFRSRFEKEIRIREKVNMGRVLLVTSEHFSSRLRTWEELSSIKEFLEGYFESIKIICYFRAQLEMAVSLHSTSLKGQGFGSLEIRLNQVRPENYYYNFHEIAKLWASVFGKENLHFRIFEKRRLVNQDIQHDFLAGLASLGVEVDSRQFDYGKKLANESLSTLQGNTFAAINETVPYWNSAPLTGVNIDNERLKKAILDLSSLSIGKYSAENPEEVQSRFETSNKKFLSEFLPSQSFELKSSGETIDSIPLKEVEQVTYELTKTLLSEKLHSNGPRLVDSDADYLRDIAIKVLDKQPLSESHAAKLLELALRVRPEDPLIQKQLARAKRHLNQEHNPGAEKGA